MKLHFNPASPYVRMVRVTAAEVGLADEIELVHTGMVLPNEAHAAVTADNPLGKIPTLVTDHGHALYDSRVICEYLAHRGGDKDLYPDEPVQRFHILTLQTLAQGICDAAILYRYEMFMRPEELRWQSWADRQMQRMKAAVAEIDANWSETLSSLNGASISVAVMCSYLDFRFPDIGWKNDHKALAEFYEEFSKRPSMTSTGLANPT